MIRYTALWLFVFFLMRYAWKDWCKSLCGLVLMLAVLERPDMPKQILGIQGLNPFNVALAGILVAWAARRRRDNVEIPRWLTFTFSLYIAVMLLATVRLLTDPSFLVVKQHPAFPVWTTSGLISDYFVNTFKWVVPAGLFLYGCRGEERQRWLVVGVLGIYVILAYLVLRQMPLGFLLDGEALQKRAVAVLQRRVGYHRVDLATMFAGASWAMLAVRPMFTSPAVRTALVGLSGFLALGLALTGGRMGYLAWCAVGLTFGLLKWRKSLLFAPILLALALAYAPGISQRMLQGFEGGEPTDDQAITSGRNLVWPYAVRTIAQAPMAGHGRQAWVRTGVRMDVAVLTGEYVGHPHNAYLEFALDSGLIGLLILIPLFGFITLETARMFRVRNDPMLSSVGGAALAMTVAHLVSAVGAQTFYPTEGSVGMWCLMAVAVRVACERRAARRRPAAVETAGPEPVVDLNVVPARRPPVTLWPEGRRPA